MRRALAAWGTVLLLAVSVSACGDDGVKASSKSPAEPSETAEPTLPTEPSLPTELTASATTSSVPTGGAFNACDVVTEDLISANFGAEPGQSISQPSSLGDPNAQDCFWYGGEATVVVAATSRADQDLPENGFSYAGLPGAEPVPGADRGWAYVFPGQSESTVTAGLILVKGQTGFNITLSIDGHPFTIETLQTFAQDVLDQIG